MAPAIKPWLVGVVLGCIPIGTYSWVLYTRPNIYEQIAQEVAKQDEMERVRKGLPAAAPVVQGAQ